MKLTFGEIKSLFPHHSLTQGDHEIVTGICRDTRNIQPGEIYVALKGENFDGHGFVDQAFAQGAVAALVGKDFLKGGKNLIHTEDTVAALGQVASLYRKKFHQPVIAITGSSGKTTTKRFLQHVLGLSGEVVASEANLNNHIGVPVTVFRFCETARYFVIEMGMNHPGEIEYLTRMVCPDVAVITSIGHSHLEGVGGTLQGVARAKGELFANLQVADTAVVFADDPHIRAMATGARRITYGFSKGCDYGVEDIETIGGDTHFTLCHGAGRVRTSIHMTGRHNVQNALCVYTIARSLGLSDEVIVGGLTSFKIDFNRGRRLRYQETVIVDDTYNANPDSVRAALDSFCAEFPQQYKIAILGGMRELGAGAPELHRETGRLCRDIKIDELLVYGENAAEYLKGFGYSAAESKRRDFTDHEILATELKKILKDRKDAVVLVKGSRGMTMERVLKHLGL